MDAHDKAAHGCKESAAQPFERNAGQEEEKSSVLAAKQESWVVVSLKMRFS
jgi:hypothetical protein